MYHGIATYQPGLLPIRKRKRFDGKLAAFKAAITAIGGICLPCIDTYYNSLPSFVKNSASLILLPAYRSSRMYAMNPQAPSSLIELTFSRTGAAFYVDTDGVIKSAATNIPRYQFDPVTGDFQGYFHELSRTQYILNNMNPAVTNVSGSTTATTTAITTPYPGATCFYRTGSTSNASCFQVASSGTFTTGALYTVSCFVKQNTTPYANFGLKLTAQITVDTVRCNLDFATGVVTASWETTPTDRFFTPICKARKFNNGWWWVSLSVELENMSVVPGPVAYTDYNPAFAYSDAYHCLPQFTTGVCHEPTLILTSGSAVTKAADSLTLPYTYINNTGCSVLLDFIAYRGILSTYRICSLTDPSRILSVHPTTSEAFFFRESTPFNINSIQPYVTGQRYKSISSWGGVKKAISMNYLYNESSDYGGTMATSGSIAFFNSGSTQGLLKSFIIFQRQLSQAEMLQLTTIKP